MSDALKMLPHTVEHRVRLALAALRQIYPDVDIASHIVGDPITVTWEADEHSLGAFKGALPDTTDTTCGCTRTSCRTCPPISGGIFLAGDDISWTPAGLRAPYKPR